MKRFWIGTAIFLAVLSLLYVGIKSIPVPIGYALIAEFEEVPPSDWPLEKWMSSQQGATYAYVFREKIENRWSIRICVGITRDGWENSLYPKIESKCDELGYRGISGRFRSDRD